MCEHETLIYIRPVETVQNAWASDAASQIGRAEIARNDQQRMDYRTNERAPIIVIMEKR